MPKTKTRRIKEIEEGGLPENLAYCRRCMDVKSKNYFHGAVNHDLDRNHCLSFCKSCVDEMFAGFLASEGSLEKAVLKLCRIVDLKYIPEAIDAAKKQALAKGVDQDKIFGYYKSKVIAVSKTSTTDSFENLNLSFQDNIIINFGNETPSLDDVEESVVSFWGKGYKIEEYRWLEDKFDEWTKTHRSDTMAEQTLLKEIVFKQFEIEKVRESKTGSTASLIKELQDLMKTASVDPAKSNVAGAGKSQDTFSAFIKMIEEDEPAEVFGDERDAFKDFQGIEKYFEKYVRRPLRNFVTMSRDFNVDSDEEDFENEFDIMEQSLPEIPEIQEEDIKKLEE